MRLLSIDSFKRMSFDPCKLARITGLRPDDFTADTLRPMPMHTLLPALGCMALVMLASMREHALSDFQKTVREDIANPTDAVAVMGELMEVESCP